MNRLPLAVTTSGKAGPKLLVEARSRAAAWGLPFLERPRKSALTPLFSRARALLVFRADGTTLCDEQGAVQFTPGMAMLRVKRLDQGLAQNDPLLDWSELKPGDRVLDCTVGLGVDAFVAARVVGPHGRVLGLEKSLAMFAVVSEGLSRYPMGPSFSRIEVRHEDAAEYLKNVAPGAFDVVLFDPMFERPRKASGAFELLRRHADHSPLSKETLLLGQRVARRWVLVKGSRYSADLKHLGLLPLPASRSSTVVWGRLPGLGGASPR